MNEIKSNRFNTTQCCKFIFYLSFFFFLISDMFSQIKFISNYLNYFDILAVLLLCVCFIIQNKNYDTKKFLKLITLIMLSIVTYYFSNDKCILKLVLLIVASKNIKFDEFIKKDFQLKIILTIIVVIAFFLGITNNVFVYRNGILRNSFGFIHPNRLGLYLMMICLDYYYIMRKKNILKPLILSLIISVLLFLFVDSRTSLVIIILCTIFAITNKIINGKILNLKLVKFISKNLFIILSLIVLLLSFKYNVNDDLSYNINKLISGRLYLNQYFLLNYDFSLFGSVVETTKYLILDCSFLNLLLRFGIFIFIWFYIILHKSINDMYKNKNYMLIIIFALLICYGFSESFFYKAYTNAFLLYFSKFYNEQEVIS